MARRIVYGCLCSFVVFIVVAVVTTILLLPSVLAASWKGIGDHLAAMGAAAGRWDTIKEIVGALQVALLALPLLGLALTFGTVATRPLKTDAGRHWDESRIRSNVAGRFLRQSSQN